MKSLLLILLTLNTFFFYSQSANCARCEGTGMETKHSPYHCQNCISWNAEYRKKVPCNICKDTRNNTNFKTWKETCSKCKGTGRDYEQEARNKEFGDFEYKLVATPIYSGTIDNIVFKSLELEVRQLNQSINNRREKFSESEIENSICSCLGTEWRLPNINELESVAFEINSSGKLRSGYNKDSDDFYISSSIHNEMYGSKVFRSYTWGIHIVEYGCCDRHEQVLLESKEYPVICVKKTVEEPSAIELNNSTTNESNNSSTTETNKLRDPRSKDVANVFWNGNYPLYSLVDDIEIMSDVNGNFNIWYATNEDKTPRQTTMKSGQVITVYKFSSYDECHKWCNGN